MKTNKIFFILLLAISTGCKDDPTAPEDISPFIASFSATPSFIKQGGSTTFDFSLTDDNGLEKAILNYGDGTADTIQLSGQKSYVGSKSKKYMDSGTKNVKLDVFDNANQKTVKTVDVLVNVLPPPAFKKNSVSFAEGDSVAYAMNEFIYEPNNLPFTLSIVSSPANLSVVVTPDSVKIAGANSDVNGTYNIQMKADNGITSKVQNVGVVISALDEISGRVRDDLEGSYIATLSPELVMKGPFTGWVAMKTGNDSLKIAINNDGTFKFPKVTPGTHRVYRFATNGVDSSFVAYDDFPAGDRVVDAFVCTNAGTDNSTDIVTAIPLQILQDFYVGTNFRGMNLSPYDNGYGRVNGMDFSKTNTFYLAGTDVVTQFITYLHNTPEQQDFLATNLEEWRSLLPSSVRQNVIIYKAPQGETIPMKDTSNFAKGPPLNMGWFFVDNSGGALGTFTAWYDEYVMKRAFMTYDSRYSQDKQRPVQLQEGGSWLCAPGSVFDPRFRNKSIFFEGTVFKITNFDKKLLYMAVMHLGAVARQYWSMP